MKLIWSCIERHTNQTHSNFRSVVKNMKFSQKTPTKSNNPISPPPPQKKTVGKTILKTLDLTFHPHPGWLACHTRQLHLPKAPTLKQLAKLVAIAGLDDTMCHGWSIIGGDDIWGREVGRLTDWKQVPGRFWGRFPGFFCWRDEG